MAMGTVLSVAQTLFAALQCKELRELCSTFKYDSQLQALRDTLETIQNVLLDAESRQHELNNQELEWVNKLKDAVYEADDLFDKFATVAQRQKRMPGGKISKKVRTFLSSENQLLFGFRTSKEIKEIRKKLDSIANDRTRFGFSDVCRPIKRKEETSYVHEDSIIGRDADKEVIMGMLLRESDSSVDNVSFVSIVGMGGLGKTALAQLVYNDVRINDKFDLKLWVCVSDHDEFILQEILFKMLKSATEQDYGDIGAEGVQNKVRQRIEGKKYFLILDDLWNESRDEWLKLREFLQVGARGSRVVVTTRSKKVARAIGDDDPIYTLRGLSDDDSWSLFKRVAFNRGSREVDDDFVEIGKNIVKKCGNVPLAIRVVGSMLYGHEKSKWKLFQRMELSEMGQREESIMPILKFSYHHLPPQLKSCFSYCALFPKDYEIEKELLIRLWSAQGYLEPANDLQNMEDVGEEYFSILLQRCFLQDYGHRVTYGEVVILYCKMHDLIHDLAQEVAGKELYMIEDTCKYPFEGKTRHLAILARRPLLLSSGDTVGNLKGIRTFLRHSDSQLNCESQVTTILAKCRHLRVLDLHNLGIKALPSTIKSLLHLRYLDLSDNRQLMTLPESITTLYNLQVLNLRDCDYLKELPKDLKELVNLRHLDLTNCYGLTHMPAGMDSITSLCTLTQFVLGRESSKKSRIGQLEDLMPLINLRGTLDIIFKEGYKYNLAANAEERAYLLNKEHIKRLRILDEGAWKRNGAVIERLLLERLEPHHNLREIDIIGYKGVTLPRWAATLSMSLPQLESISLGNFHDLQQLPALGQLQHLQELRVYDMPNVELMENDDNCAPLFPSLMILHLERCPSLKSFPRCPNVKSFSLRGLNEALAFCKIGDDEANATTPAASSFSASSSSGNGDNSAGDDVFDLQVLHTDNLGLIKSLFGESLRSIYDLTLCDDTEVESLSSVVQEFYQKYAFSILSLRFEGFRYLKSVSSGGMEHLTNLKTLTLLGCLNLELEEEQGFPWKSLHTLFYLKLFSLPKLVHLPNGVQYLTSLRALDVVNCENVETLPEWLDCLKSLRSLEIMSCPRLKLLPEAILPSLTSLRIHSCDGLKERYSESNGTYFHKISRIPNLDLCF